ncbi:MAG: hypothetical protein AB1714_11810 [Acidobacteriota bacterium]
MDTRSAVNRLVRVGVLAVPCSAMLLGAELGSTLTVGASFAGGELIKQGGHIELSLSRPLGPTDGRLAVFLNEMDLTPLFTLEGTKFTIRPTFPSLPTGEHTMIVYLFAPDESWREVARFPLRIEETPSEPVVLEPAVQAGGTTSQWSATWVPSVTLNVAHQSTLEYYPDTNRPERTRFTDVSLQASVQAGLARGLFNTQTQFDIMGASFEQQALRYGEMGDSAPQVDLSSYLASAEINKVKVQLGHTSFGGHRYLINSFNSRGITLTVPIAGWADVSFSGMNGTSIVGWDNFSGLSRRKHQVYGGTVGLELVPKRPGGARLELSALHGSLLPVSNYNQSNLNDAETSRGYGARILASDTAQRLRLEAGIARSRFTNPSDPLLDQGTTVVPVRAATGLAHYLDVSYQMLRDRPVTEQWMSGLTLALRYSRVDPLYRSTAVFAQSDRFDTQYELSGNVGDITATGSYTRGNDNLAGVTSVLKTLTRRANGQFAVPLPAVFSVSGLRGQLFPRVGYSYDRTHQYGASMPTGGDFDPSSVPDQVSTNQILTADWQLANWRFGYRLNQSFQDNRQIGRAGSDLKNRVNSMTLGVTPHKKLDVSFDLSSERSLNYETGARYQIWRSTAALSLQTTLRSMLTLTIGTTFEGDVAKSNDSRNIDLDAQWAAGFSKQKDRFRKFDTQFFIRYAQRYASSYDHVFITENLTRLQTVNAGLKITFF